MDPKYKLIIRTIDGHYYEELADDLRKAKHKAEVLLGGVSPLEFTAGNEEIHFFLPSQIKRIEIKPADTSDSGSGVL